MSRCGLEPHGPAAACNLGRASGAKERAAKGWTIWSDGTRKYWRNVLNGSSSA